MAARKRILFPALALSLGLLMAGIALSAFELRARQRESASGIQLTWGHPHLRYVLRSSYRNHNRWGFRGEDWALLPAAGTIRVVVLGDSVTNGANVPMNLTYPAQAQRILREAGWPVEILNLAVVGYDLSHIQALMATRGWQFHPHLVVYGYFTNDAFPCQLINVGTPPYPVFVGDPSISPYPFLSWPGVALLQHHSALARRFIGARVAREHGKPGRGNGIPRDVQQRIFLAAWQRLLADVQLHQVPFVTLLIPSHTVAGGMESCRSIMHDKPDMCNEQERAIGEMTALALKDGVHVIDGMAAYQHSGQTAFFQDGSNDPHHPSAQGHLVLGQALAEGLLPLLGYTPSP